MRWRPWAGWSMLRAASLGSVALNGWVNFNGVGVLSIRDSENVASVTDNGTFDFTINWARAQAALGAATRYAMFGGCSAQRIAMAIAGNGSLIPTSVRVNSDSGVEQSVICIVAIGGWY